MSVRTSGYALFVHQALSSGGGLLCLLISSRPSGAEVVFEGAEALAGWVVVGDD